MIEPNEEDELRSQLRLNAMMNLSDEQLCELYGLEREELENFRPEIESGRLARLAKMNAIRDKAFASASGKVAAFKALHKP